MNANTVLLGALGLGALYMLTRPAAAAPPPPAPYYMPPATPATPATPGTNGWDFAREALREASKWGQHAYDALTK